MTTKHTSLFASPRRIAFGLLAGFFVSGIFLNGHAGLMQETYADDISAQITTGSVDTMGDQTNKVDTIQMIDVILKMVYVLLWPLLVLAGWAMDNTLVYGSLFGLDAPLWKFWNMLKNFANFGLGFLVLFYILKSIFVNKGAGSFSDGKTPLGIIKKTLVAGILIQASRFLMAALIDVSTIATYAVGGLPLSVIQNTDLGKQKILSVNAKLDLSKFNITQNGKTFMVTYGAGTHKLSSCTLSNNGGLSSSAKYVVGRTTTTDTEVGLCVLFGNTVIPFKEAQFHTDFLAAGCIEDDYINFTNGTNNSWGESQDNMDKWVQKGDIVDITSTGFASAKLAGKSWLDATDATTLSDVINKSKGFVGPLVTMYSSLLNFAQISDTSITSLGAVSGEVVIKSLIAVALVIPLLALAVVLIVRVGFLWLVIAASPLLVLKEVFGKDLKMEGLDKMGFGLTNILSVIFAPVVTVFALSISLIFLSALIQSFTPTTTSGSAMTSPLEPEIHRIETTDKTKQSYDILGMTSLEFQNFSRGGSLDWFSWLIVNLVAIGLLWAILFAAIKANSLGKQFAAPIQKFSENMFGTMPLVPLPGGENVGVMSAANVISNAPSRRVQHRQTEQENVARDIINHKETTTKTTITTEQAGTIADNLIGGKTVSDAISPLNENKTAGQEITTASFFANAGNVQGVRDIINKNEDEDKKKAGLEALSTGWGKDFTDRVTGSTTIAAPEITNQLNSSDTAKEFAQTLVNNNTKLTNKANQNFSVSLDSNKKGYYKVDKTGDAPATPDAKAKPADNKNPAANTASATTTSNTNSKPAGITTKPKVNNASTTTPNTNDKSNPPEKKDVTPPANPPKQ